MLHENLRQRCLYEIANEYHDEDEHVFLNYLYNARARCLEHAVTTKCSRKTMEGLGVKWDAIQKCMSFEKDGGKNNTGMSAFFEEDRQKLVEYGITLTPALVINGHPYRGEMKGDAIFNQICQSYKMNKRPLVCSEGYDIEPELG